MGIDIVTNKWRSSIENKKYVYPWSGFHVDILLHLAIVLTPQIHNNQDKHQKTQTTKRNKPHQIGNKWRTKIKRKPANQVQPAMAIKTLCVCGYENLLLTH